MQRTERYPGFFGNGQSVPVFFNCHALLGHDFLFFFRIASSPQTDGKMVIYFGHLITSKLFRERSEEAALLVGISGAGT